MQLAARGRSQSELTATANTASGQLRLGKAALQPISPLVPTQAATEAGVAGQYRRTVLATKMDDTIVRSVFTGQIQPKAGYYQVHHLLY